MFPKKFHPTSTQTIQSFEANMEKFHDIANIRRYLGIFSPSWRFPFRILLSALLSPKLLQNLIFANSTQNPIELFIISVLDLLGAIREIKLFQFLFTAAIMVREGLLGAFTLRLPFALSFLR